jgi:hypothetical protein
VRRFQRRSNKVITPQKLRFYIDLSNQVLPKENYICLKQDPPLPDGRQEIVPGLWAEIYQGAEAKIARIYIDEAERWLLEQALFGGSR